MLEVDKRKSETKKIKPNTETLRFNMKKPSDVKGKNTGSDLSGLRPKPPDDGPPFSSPT
jgi:hypothetical protein